MSHCRVGFVIWDSENGNGACVLHMFLFGLQRRNWRMDGLPWRKVSLEELLRFCLDSPELCATKRVGETRDRSCVEAGWKPMMSGRNRRAKECIAVNCDCCWLMELIDSIAERKTSLGRDWHGACLRCDKCNKTLVPGQHSEHDDKPYCNNPCYSALFGPGGNHRFTKFNRFSRFNRFRPAVM